MRRFFAFMLLIITLVAGCIFSMNDDYNKDVGGDGAVYNITGKFIDNNGNIIAGLTVTLSGEIEKTTVTNENGEYIFENVPVGSYTVTPGNKRHGLKSFIVTNDNVDIGTNSDGHGESVNGDYSCALCH